MNKVGRETELQCWRAGSGVASHKWWEWPVRQIEGISAISIREGMSVCLCTCVSETGREVCKDDEGGPYRCGKHT